VVGASGYGKSVLLGKIIEDRVKRGEGVLFVDLKADRETIERIKSVAKDNGRADDLKIFSLSNTNISSSYNPILEGSANQIRDRLVGAMEWSEEFYKQASSSHLLKVLSLLVWRRDSLGLSFSMADVFSLISQEENLENYLQVEGELPEHIQKMASDIVELFQSKEKLNNLMGIKCQLESLLLYSDFQKLICKF
jgi:hypothetical protein